jgi:hypothetical protein
MFLVNTYRWEWTTIAALIAPRPLLFCNSDNDPIFPMDGNRRIIARLRQIYKMYGKPELVDDYVSHGGHAYRPDLRIAIFTWINKHIKNDTGPVKDADFKPISGRDLRVFPEDKDVPKDAVNGRIDEIFVRRPQIQLPDASGFESWNKELLQKLWVQCFSQVPEHSAGASLGLFIGGLGQHGRRRLVSERGVEFEVWGDRSSGEKSVRATIVVENPVNPDDPIDATNGYSIYPRCTLERWTHKSPPNCVERSHALVGRTVDEGRVLDVVEAIRFLGAREKRTQWSIWGKGQAGVLAAYAALFEPSITEVVVVNPPASHRDGPIFLNVLRILDIPEALGLLAPRKLILVGAGDKVFDRTVEIYKLAGAQAMIERK